MGQLNTLHQNGKTSVNGFTPILIKSKPTDQAARYQAALDLVALIDENLSTGRQHYRTKSGQLLRTLDEVVRAILADNLVIETNAVTWDQDLARAA